MPEKKQDKKQYYSVEVECLIPATVKYKVFAKDPQEALELIKGSKPISPPKFNLAQMKKKAAKVYKWGYRIVEYLKRY